MKHLIVANWKLNPASQKEAEALFDEVKKKGKSKNAEVVICPPFIYLPALARLSSQALRVGGQNMFWEEKGAFTGEVSGAQLKDLKVEYVIIGHSERRKYFAETDEIVNKKIKKALDAKLKVILCVGENAGEDKVQVLEKQITQALRGLSKFEIQNSKLTIAYEPVWAIGTGNSCSVDQTMGSVLLIKKIISNLYNREAADNLRVLYGGSVTSKNSADYVKNAGVNGLLVGGASLNAEEFVKIVLGI